MIARVRINRYLQRTTIFCTRSGCWTPEFMAVRTGDCMHKTVTRSIKPFRIIPKCIVEGVMKSHPYLISCWQLMAIGEKSTFSSGTYLLNGCPWNNGWSYTHPLQIPINGTCEFTKRVHEDGKKWWETGRG